MSSFLKTCLQQWKWFAGFVCLTVIAAILFLLMVAPKFERTASVLIKDENGSGGLLSSITIPDARGGEPYGTRHKV